MMRVAVTQGRNPADVLEALSAMTPEAREQALAGLPPAQQARIAAGLKQLEGLTPDERRRWLARFRRFQQFNPEEKERFRSVLRDFRLLPPDRRSAVHLEMRKLQTMPAAARQERMSSEDFRTRFAPNERQLLRLSVSLLPQY